MIRIYVELVDNGFIVETIDNCLGRGKRVYQDAGSAAEDVANRLIIEETLARSCDPCAIRNEVSHAGDGA